MHAFENLNIVLTRMPTLSRRAKKLMKRPIYIWYSFCHFYMRDNFCDFLFAILYGYRELIIFPYGIIVIPLLGFKDQA